MTKRETLYHLTPTESVGAILREGLRADEDGNIFAFTDLLVANTIAKDQVFTDKYGIFLVDPAGITGDVVSDNVAELSAGYQRIIKQRRIRSRSLRFVGEYDTIFDRPTEWDYLVDERRGHTRERTDEWFAIARWSHEHRPKPGFSQEEYHAELRRRYAVIGIDYESAMVESV